MAAERFLAAILALAAGGLVIPAAGAARAQAQPVVIRVDPARRGPATDAVVRTVPEALARAAALRSRSQATGAIVIELAAGIHRIDRPIRIGADAGGRPGAPLVLRGAKDGIARLSGSVPLAQVKRPPPRLRHRKSATASSPIACRAPLRRSAASRCSGSIRSRRLRSGSSFSTTPEPSSRPAGRTKAGRKSSAAAAPRRGPASRRRVRTRRTLARRARSLDRGLSRRGLVVRDPAGSHRARSRHPRPCGGPALPVARRRALLRFARGGRARSTGRVVAGPRGRGRARHSARLARHRGRRWRGISSRSTARATSASRT